MQCMCTVHVHAHNVLYPINHWKEEIGGGVGEGVNIESQTLPSNIYLYLALSLRLKSPHFLLQLLILHPREHLLPVYRPHGLHQTVAVPFLALKAVGVAAALVLADEVALACDLDYNLWIIEINWFMIFHEIEIVWSLGTVSKCQRVSGALLINEKK